jgi:hypothetical protein
MGGKVKRPDKHFDTDGCYLIKPSVSPHIYASTIRNQYFYDLLPLSMLTLYDTKLEISTLPKWQTFSLGGSKYLTKN